MTALFSLPSGFHAAVVGGAGDIGAAISNLLCDLGATVTATAVDDAAISRSQLRPRAGLTVQKLDVTSEADWQRAVETTIEAFDRLDILVNNAGISGSFDPDTLSTAAWDALMNVNAKGVFLGMKHAIPKMREAGGGAIVNISSISGFVGQDRLHMAYNASKGAVRIMTKSAAVQYARDGIRVNSVHPGFMPPMRTSKVSADPAWRKPFLDAVPLKREGRVEEVAHAVLFLASDEASYITGTELVVDGGFLAV